MVYKHMRIDCGRGATFDCELSSTYSTVTFLKIGAKDGTIERISSDLELTKDIVMKTEREVGLNCFNKFLLLLSFL